jgi:hypothetical protein
MPTLSSVRPFLELQRHLTHFHNTIILFEAHSVKFEILTELKKVHYGLLEVMRPCSLECGYLRDETVNSTLTCCMILLQNVILLLVGFRPKKSMVSYFSSFLVQYYMPKAHSGSDTKVTGVTDLNPARSMDASPSLVCSLV